jgi:superfamily II DNA or RNA helicase
MPSAVYRQPESGNAYALLRAADNFGIPEVDVAAPPPRFWDDNPRNAPRQVELGLDEARLIPAATPAELLSALPDGDNWTAMSRRSLARLMTWFFICEDPQQRLRAQPVASLAHQASLVKHVLSQPNLSHVLIADEVGLGKTVEAGLIIKELLAENPGLRVLYLAPARLVRNVRRELDNLELLFRQWVSGADSYADLRTDGRVVASIHRAVHDAHFEKVINTPSWDVIIVDECHHLSAWEPNGGKPVMQYRLVQELAARQRMGARLILMSGTPHQGHRDRFRNLLQLLKEKGESNDALAGRVIYRTKDDVRDWNGNPIFPARQVNEPTVIDLGPAHAEWLRHIHEFYSRSAGFTADKDSRHRAAGWRTAQALQWATSSVQAGLGYLVRQAVRAGWNLDRPELVKAVESIRPYRLGAEDEPIPSLFERIRREVLRQASDRDVEDIEDEGDDAWHPDPQRLCALLSEGVDILEKAPDTKWQLIMERLLRPAGDDKVVLFAQPIETVRALARFLQKTTGRAPAMIVGDQSEEDREKQIADFWRADGPQYLVSSRAGGEGINLQVAWRLVHVDVPWNPMELEQRVGRVHRYGSREKIIVDTVVTKDSREIDMYRVAREKLLTIASELVPADRFEPLFGRVMSLVPPEELQTILGERPLSPLTEDEQRRIANLVSQGFDAWQDFHRRYSDERISQLDPGQATWEDLKKFAIDHLNAQPVSGFRALRFMWDEGQIRGSTVDTPVLRLKDGKIYAAGDFAGMPISGPDGERVSILGLNLPAMCDVLRDLGLPQQPTGAAHLRWPTDRPLPEGVTQKPFAVWIAARQTVSLANGIQPATTLQVFVVTTDGTVICQSGRAKGELIRGLRDSVVRKEAEPGFDLLDLLGRHEKQWILDLRRPTEEERANRLASGVTPLFAAIVS